MSKEELEKEAIAKYKTGSYPQLHPDIRAFIHGYLAGAEPRENKIVDIKANCDLAIEGRDIKIKELEKENEELEKESNRLFLEGAKRVEELEQQIEKMKRHCNCKHRDSEGYCEVKRTYLIDLSYDGCDKWELED